MELLGVIRALQALNKPCQVTIYSDSKYVVDAFNQHWVDNWLKKNWVKSDKKPVKNVDLWKTLLEAKAPHQVQFVWVKGHDGHPENERCDQLATSAADQPEANLLDDVPLIAQMKNRWLCHFKEKILLSVVIAGSFCDKKETGHTQSKCFGD